MSPDVFHKRLLEILATTDYDPEAKHCAMDELMEEELIRLGYKKSIELIRAQTRWYA